MNPEQKVQLSLAVLLTGLVIVFVMLIFLTCLIKRYGSILSKFMEKNNISNETKAVSVPVPVLASRANNPKAAPVTEAGIPEEVIAAISAAVYMMYGNSGAAVTGIRRSVQSTRSAWSMAGLLDNTRPF